MQRGVRQGRTGRHGEGIAGEREEGGVGRERTGGHGEGVAGEGAGLVHGTRGGHNLHDLLLAACAYGRGKGRQDMSVSWRTCHEGGGSAP